MLWRHPNRNTSGPGATQATNPESRTDGAAHRLPERPYGIGWYHANTQARIVADRMISSRIPHKGVCAARL